MTGSTSIIVLFGVAGVVLVGWLHLRIDPGTPGRFLLLALRTVTLALVTTLILDLRIPGEDPSCPSPEGGKWILIDPDLSLTIPGASGASLWDEAVERVADLNDGTRVAMALPGNGGAEGVELGDLSTRMPSAPSANLREAVSRLGEAGADSVVVLSTLRRPSEDVAALVSETPLPMRLDRLGGLVRNVGIGELSLPAYASEGEEISGSVGVFGEGAAGDSVRLELRGDGELITIIYLPMPDSGEEVSVPFTLPPPVDTGLVRYTASGLLEGDVFEPDDVRARWLMSGRVDPEILLVSLEPDWEPRVLLPVLKEVTGLDGDGYLGLADGRFLPLVSEPGITRPVEAEAFRDRLLRAELLVIQGDAEGAPPWLISSVESHPRVLHIAGSSGAAALAGLQADPILPGEWAPDPDVPASPLSPFFAGISLGGLPPLSALLPLAEPLLGTSALNAQGPRGGEPVPAVVLLESEQGRRVVTLASGFWRWGMRDGEALRAYRALWGGVTGWLLGQSMAGDGEPVRPETILQGRGESLRWEVDEPGSEMELSLLRVHDSGDGSWKQDPADSLDLHFRGPLRGTDDPVVSTPSVEPGVYRFEVRGPGNGGQSEASIIASGFLEVEGWAPSLRWPPFDVSDDVVGSARGPNLGDVSGGRRTLRTHPLPYLLLLVLLGTEWVWRRKVGLR